jgi:RNA polymerase sigma factor (sigma-70 family)
MYYDNDDIMVQRCIAGDGAAWEELVNHYGRLVYSIPRRYGLSAADADDVFQNVFSIVLQRLPSLRDQKMLAAWLITITHRESWRLRRREKIPEELDESVVDDGTPPQEQVLIWERQHVVHQALERLGEPCRKLLIALFLDPSEQSYKEIATQLGIAVGSIGPTRARCFKKLEAILVDMGVDLG